MNIESIIRQLTLTEDYSHIINHIKQTNPHEPGGPRDAMKHGLVYPDSFLWAQDPIELPIDLFSDKRGVVKRSISKYARMIEKGSLPPAIIIVINENGRIGLCDGGHRISAARDSGLSSMMVYVGVSKEYKKD